jgi:hypothetical protein
MLFWESNEGSECTYHEITLYEVQLVGKTLLGCITSSTVDLVVVIIQTGYVCACELCDFSRRSPNTAANVKDLVSILDTDFCGEIVFVAGNCLVEWFSVCETAEMERLAPSVLVKISSKVVITARISNCKVAGRIRAYCLVRVAYSAFRA